MAWVRDHTGQQAPVTDDDLLNEIRTGELSPDAEVRHPAWTDNRFQPIHTVEALQAAVSAPQALLSARLRRKAVPWGTAALLSLIATILYANPSLSRLSVIGLGAGEGLHTDPGWQHAWSAVSQAPLLSVALLLALALLASLERAFGAAVFLTPAVLLGAPFLLVDPALFFPVSALALAAAAAGAGLQHRALLHWRWRGRYGIWCGLPLLSVPFLFFVPTWGPLLAGAVSLAAALGAWLSPLPSLAPALRRRALNRHLAACAGAVTLLAGGLVFVGQKPLAFLDWESVQFEPAGIILDAPTFVLNDRNNQLWLGERWFSNEEILLRVSMSIDEPKTTPGALIRQSTAGGIFRQVSCAPQERLRNTAVCAAILDRVVFLDPYTDDGIQEGISVFRAKIETAALRLLSIGRVDLAERTLRVGLDNWPTLSSATRTIALIDTLWRDNPELRLDDATRRLLGWWADDIGRRSAASLGLESPRLELVQALREEPCEVAWLRLRWAAPDLPSEQHSAMLHVLGCPRGLDDEALPDMQRLPADHLEQTLQAMVEVAADEHAALRRLGAHARRALDCGALGARLPAQPEERARILQHVDCG